MLNDITFQARQPIDDCKLRRVALDFAGFNARRVLRSDRARHDSVNRADASLNGEGLAGEGLGGEARVVKVWRDNEPSTTLHVGCHLPVAKRSRY
jgi:hypothetical protein